MLIVVEGPDGSGKSTLVESLRKNPRGKYTVCVRASRPSADHLYQFTNAIIELEDYLSPAVVVLDRYHPISEAVYGSTLRDGDLFDDRIHWSFYFEPVDLIVYCRPAYRTILENLTKNLQMAGVHDRIEELVACYDRLMQVFEDFTQVMHYDYEEQKIDSVYDRIYGAQ